MATDTYTSNYSLFDPNAFLDVFYSEVREPISFGLNFFYNVYKSGLVEGSTFLDFGSGPAISCVIPASRYFPNIYLSDFSENNRNSLWRWLNKDRDSHDFSPFFDYVKNKDAEECITGSVTEDGFRSKIRGILSCDMTLENPLYPSIFPQFDVISSSFCLEASASKSEYRAAVKNVASLLKPGGWMTLFGSVNQSFFRFGNFKYPSVTLTPRDVQQVWTETGFTIEVWEQQDRKENTLTDASGKFGLACRKKAYSCAS